MHAILLGRNTLIISLATLLASSFPISLSAETVVVENIINVKSSSGGNVSTGGEVVTGASKNNISVETIVNDEVVENFTSESDKDISYERTTKVSASSSVRTDIKTITTAVNDHEGAKKVISRATSSKKVATSTLITVASSTQVSVRFIISNLLTKIFSYVSLLVSFR